MSKLSDAKEILNALQVPTKQQNGMCCCVLLAMAGLTEELPWSEATNNWIRIHDVIAFVNSNYGMTYAENSRETFRKQAMHHFRNAAFIEDNGKATNSPNYRYRLTDEMLRLIQSFGQNMWGEQLSTFLENHDTLVEIYASKRAMRKMPVKINGADFTFSPGKHNQLQKAIIEEFAPRSYRKQSSKNLHRVLLQIRNVYMLGIPLKRIWSRTRPSCASLASPLHCMIRCRMWSSTRKRGTGCIL